jgi:hypothetical protein
MELLDYGEADQHRLMLSNKQTNKQTDVVRWAVAISRLTVTDDAYTESDCNANKPSPNLNPKTRYVQQ